MRKDEINKSSLKYERNRLRELIALLEDIDPTITMRPVTNDDLLMITEGMFLFESYSYDGRVIAMLAVIDEAQINTLVVGEESLQYIRNSPKGIIDGLAQQLSDVADFSVVAMILAEVLGESDTRGIPYVVKDFSLIPFGPVTSPETSWISPAHLDELIFIDDKPYLELSFGLVIPSSTRTERTVVGYMQTALSLQGVFMRDKFLVPGTSGETLQHYLGLRDSVLVRKACRGLMFKSIPKEKLLSKTARQYVIEDHARKEEAKSDEGAA